MRLTQISITDLAAFAGTVTFPLYGISLIKGDHGKGKSSLGEILLYSFGRRPLAETGSVGIRHDAAILHGNAERGEAVLSFDDGSSFRVLVTADSTTRMIKVPEGTKWNKATPEYIDSLVNALSYDPFVFKTLSEKQRIEALLKASPIIVTAEEIAEAVGEFGKHVIGAPSLESINATHGNLYDYRRTANVAADTNAKHAGELEAALPAEELPTVDVAPLRAEKAAVEKSELELIEKCRRKLEEFKGQAQAAHEVRKNNADKEIDAKIAELEADRKRRHEASNKQFNADIDVLREQANAAVLAKRSEIKPDLERLTAEIATAEERALRAATDKGTRNAAKKAREAQSAALADSQRIDAAMTRLNALKEAVAARLAIPDITIASPRPGQPVDICRLEGEALVPFSRWNEADKERFCLRMAVLFHGKCGMVFVDEIGHFTDERRRGLIETARRYAKDGEMQFIMGSATAATAEDPKGGELRVVEG